MHTIFVTVNEFLSNGGKLEFERALFYSIDSPAVYGKTYKRIGWFDPADDHDTDINAGTLRVNTHDRSYMTDIYTAYVEIHSTPIYK